MNADKWLSSQPIWINHRQLEDLITVHIFSATLAICSMVLFSPRQNYKFCHICWNTKNFTIINTECIISSNEPKLPFFLACKARRFLSVVEVNVWIMHLLFFIFQDISSDFGDSVIVQGVGFSDRDQHQLDLLYTHINNLHGPLLTTSLPLPSLFLFLYLFLYTNVYDMGRREREN